MLSRATIDSATGRTNFQAGLDYRCYEGAWGFLPDFAKLHPVKTGAATNFNLNVRTRTDAVGLEFDGFITIPRDGVYTFYLASDDGSRLFVGESSLTIDVLSNGPAPRVVVEAPATLLERKSRPWATFKEPSISRVFEKPVANWRCALARMTFVWKFSRVMDLRRLSCRTPRFGFPGFMKMSLGKMVRAFRGCC